MHFAPSFLFVIIVQQSYSVMDPPRWLLILLFRPLRLLIICVAIAFVSIQLAMRYGQHNPNSHFFDPTLETFQSPISDARKFEARNWIEQMDVRLQEGNVQVQRFKSATGIASGPELAVVFLTVRRPKDQFLDASIGSFLMDIPNLQRPKIHVSLSSGETEPNNQPFFSSAWLHGLLDQIVIRKEPKEPYLPAAMASRKDQPHASLMIMQKPLVNLSNMNPRTNDWQKAGTSDYSIALEICEKTNGRYCLIIEDDVIFKKGWYNIFEQSLRKAEERTHARGTKQWAYLRFFYAEKYFGWENEEVQKLVLGCSIIVGIVAILILVFGRVPARYATIAGVRSKMDLLRAHEGLDHDERKIGRGGMARARLPFASQLIVLSMTLYYCVLFILLGRNLVYKVPEGVSLMNTRGCCTQAILYPNEVVRPLKDHIRHDIGFMPYHNLINRWLDAHDKDRLTISPPLVQHIGAGSPKAMLDETYLRSTPVWSFAFEQQQKVKIGQ
jgi:hypothetical protein